MSLRRRHRERIGERDTPRRGRIDQRLLLARGAENRTADRAGEPAALDMQPVRNGRVEADLGGNPVGEQAEAARDEQAISAIGPHGPHQGPRTGREPDALGMAVDRRLVEAGEQGDAGVERTLEVEVPAHRLLGHRRDLVPQPGIIGEFVDALLPDHRHIHVGYEQPLAAAGTRLDDEVDAREQAFERLARAFGSGRQREVAGAFRFDPFGLADPPSASRAAEISPRVSRSDAIRVAMNKPAPSKKPLALIAGPTASGKSALALALAQSANGW